MPDEIRTPPVAGDTLRNSSRHLHSQAQREAISKRMGIESEKTGHDIGFEQALSDWLIKHRAQWLKRRQQEYLV